MQRISKEDLVDVLSNTKDIWDLVRGKSIFITGATGFFGKWLLESFLYANNELQLGATVYALSRNPDSFLNEFPFYKDEPSITFIKGDVLDFQFPQKKFQYIIHAATDADAKLNLENPLLMLDTITKGTRNILDFAKQQNGLEAFLLTSSGAIYGKQPPEVTHIKETDNFPIDINDPASAYTEGKRIAELYCKIYNKQFGIPIKIARCFAFVGAYLPLNKHFAIGNFILNVINNENIEIKGDGTPLRSYLYASDLITWLWKILIKGDIMEPYNVGSDEECSIADLAAKVAEFNNSISVNVAKPKSSLPPLKYVPSISKAKESLGLTINIPLSLSISKTIDYYNKLMDKKKLFITGGNGEIGKAISNKFLEQGYQVYSPTSNELDCSSKLSIEQYFVANKLDGIDVFVHCAGINNPKSFQEITPDTLERTMNINTFSFLYITQKLAPYLQITQGRVVAVASIYGVITRKKRLEYSTSKYGLIGMVKTLALELAANNVLVNSVSPGFIETKLTYKNNSKETISQLVNDIPVGKLGQPQHIGELVYFLGSAANQFITGQNIIIDGGYLIGGFQQ